MRLALLQRVLVINNAVRGGEFHVYAFTRAGCRFRGFN
jgi:hypothetical protein